MKQCSNNLFYNTIIIVFLMFATNVFAQKDSYVFTGFSFNNDFLLAKNHYNANEENLVSKGKYSNNYFFNFKINLELGYQYKDKHRFSFAAENLWLKTSYRFEYENNFHVNERREFNALNLKLNYSYKIYEFKKFSMNLGTSFGIAIPEKLNEDNKTINLFYSKDSSGNLADVLLLSVNDINIKPVFINLGLFMNFKYSFGQRNELFFTTNLTHAPYLVSGVNVAYSLDVEPTKTFQSFSKVLNFGFGIGYNVKFVKLESRKLKSGKEEVQF